jgi:quercetin dioxygenase-like cupin family protein
MIALILLAQATAAPPPPLAQIDVPDEHGPQEVVVMDRAFAPGSESGWHTHPGIEIVCAQAGTLELRMPGWAPRPLRSGECQVIPRGVVHNGANHGSEPARVSITYVVDKGAPLRAAAPAPSK